MSENIPEFEFSNQDLWEFYKELKNEIVPVLLLHTNNINEMFSLIRVINSRIGDLEDRLQAIDEFEGCSIDDFVIREPVKPKVSDLKLKMHR